MSVNRTCQKIKGVKTNQHIKSEQIHDLYHLMSLIEVDFTHRDYSELAALELLQNTVNLEQITFIVPFLLFLRNDFVLLYQYAIFLNRRPLVKTQIKPQVLEDQVEQLREFNNVIVRGTFDRFHLGHQVLILRSLYAAKSRLTIEVKDDSILRNRDNFELIQSVDLRKQNIRRFIANLSTEVEVKINTITEVYGSAPTTKHIDAISVSADSLYSSKHINRKRRSNNGYKKAAVIVTPLISVEKGEVTDSKFKLSSSKIRENILRVNNFTVQQYLLYRKVWDSAVTQVNSLCRIKDADLLVSEIWWERTLVSNSKGNRNASSTINKQIYQKMLQQGRHDRAMQHQSLKKISRNLYLFFEGICHQDKKSGSSSRQGLIKEFMQALLKKKSKNKTCKRIRQMILSNIKHHINQDRILESEIDQNDRPCVNPEGSKMEKKTSLKTDKGIDFQNCSMIDGVNSSINQSKTDELNQDAISPNQTTSRLESKDREKIQQL